MTTDIYSSSAQFFSQYFKDSKNERLQHYVALSYDRLQEGHIATNIDAKDLPQLAESEFVSTDVQQLDKPFLVHNNKFYMQRYFHYESQIVKGIVALRTEEKNLISSRISALKDQRAFIQTLFADFEESGSPQERVNWQLVAALNSAIRQFSIITGGPGTGKTTTVAKLLSLLFELDGELNVTLAAQTGKAAARLKESLNNSKNRLPIAEHIKEKFDEITPLTIHRLLGFVPNSIDFKYKASNPLHYDVVIIDESSMIDVPLLSKLFSAISPTTRLIFLGDRNQLASVEAGSIFGDLCKSAGEEINHFDESLISFFNAFSTKGQVPSTYQKATTGITDAICELKKSYRFTGDSGIGQFSKAILAEEQIHCRDCRESVERDGVCIRETLQEEEIKKYFDRFATYIQEKEVHAALQELNTIKVLCATRSGNRGVYELNKMIEKHLLDKGLLVDVNDFYEHRPILITQNDYNLGLFNGDIGICRKNEFGEMRVFFEDGEAASKLKEIVPSFIQNYETVFAMTIHKSQGSEFEHVVMVLPTSGMSDAVLTKELVYTGVTRGKKTVLIIGEETVINQAIQRPVERVSGIIERIHHEC